MPSSARPSGSWVLRLFHLLLHELTSWMDLLLGLSLFEEHAESSMMVGWLSHAINPAAAFGQWTAVVGALELAVWGIFGNIGTVVGFKHTTAVRGAFLLRLSSLFTPLIEVGLGGRIGPVVWVACLAAAIGGGMIGVDGASGQHSPDPQSQVMTNKAVGHARGMM